MEINLKEKYNLTDQEFDFVSLIDRFGVEFIEKIYPKEIFAIYYAKIVDLGINHILTKNNNFIDNISKINMINIDWLRYFAVFAEIGNTSEAGHKLNVTPQAIVKAISGIEEIIKLTLVKRVNNQFKGLTIEGNIFLEQVKYILQAFYNLDTQINKIKANENMVGKIKIVHSYSWNEFLPDIVESFMKKFPDIEISLYQLDYKKIEKWLSIGEIDLGLLPRIPQAKDIDGLKLMESPYVIVGKKSDQTDDFSNLSFIYGSSIDNDYSDNFLEEEFACKKSILVSVSLCVKMAEKGVGVLWIPEVLVKDQLKSGILSIFKNPPLYNKGFTRPIAEFFVSWNKNIYLSKISREFIKHLKEHTRYL